MLAEGIVGSTTAVSQIPEPRPDPRENTRPSRERSLLTSALAETIVTPAVKVSLVGNGAADRTEAEAIQRSDSTKPVTAECVYNLFRNRQRPELLCAVPEDRPVPGFVVAERWSVLRPLRPRDVPPPGFHSRAASAGVRFNGFYLFQVTSPPDAVDVQSTCRYE